jgi:hypothetical protein
MDLLSIMNFDMGDFADIKHLLGLWSTRAILAEALSTPDAVVTEGRVHKWAARGFIPARYWPALIRAAAQRGRLLSADDILSAHSATDRAA